MLKSILFTLAILLATTTNRGEALKDEKQLAMEVVEHIRQIRSTQPIVAWISGNSAGCKRLPSSARSFCGTDYNSPATYVNSIGPIFSTLQASFSLLQQTLGSTCTNALKTILCQGALPRCSSDSSTATFGNFQSACTSLNSCGVINIPNIGSQSFSQYCKQSGRTFSLITCSKFSGSTLNSQYCGALPANITFPNYLLQNMATLGAAISALQTTFSTGGVSNSCRAKWTNMVCVLTPFCSSDKSKQLTAVTRQQCQAAINCLPSGLQNSLSSVYNCANYPDSSGATVCMPPGEAYKMAGVTASTCTLPTGVAATVATQGQTGSAAGMTMGSALLYLASFLLATCIKIFN
ncbi:hypothetical protein TrispH2_002103 [Trichoplax sp. H2]|nr:hypothetical protein TrispH2_002103 [Trichoplax sp. H2]|eukprot:RDD45755.1 hypothetical protein TrispH2_002103 [Trichoplax sp. H2]